jgi:hypothetical protein
MTDRIKMYHYGVPGPCMLELAQLFSNISIFGHVWFIQEGFLPYTEE